MTRGRSRPDEWFARVFGDDQPTHVGTGWFSGTASIFLGALGLGAAPTTLGLMDRAAVADALGLPDTVAAFFLIPVGWPMGNFGPLTRLPVEETVRWDRW